MLTRRNLFKLFPAIGALAVPAAAIAEPEVEPIIFEHTCDGGRSGLSEEKRKRWDSPYCYNGCGTTFRWHFGVSPICPKCGWAYSMKLSTTIKRGALT
jgi:hypothetical protein